MEENKVTFLVIPNKYISLTQEQIVAFDYIITCMVKLDRINEMYAEKSNWNTQQEPLNDYSAYAELEKMIKDEGDNFLNVVVQYNGENVGMFQVINRQSKGVYLQHLFIDAKYRCRGITRQIMNYLAELYKGNTLFLKCMFNMPAKHVYEHLGFIEAYTQYGINL